MCGAASVQSVVIRKRIPYISKWSLGTEKFNGTVTTIGAAGAGAGGMLVVNEARC